MDSTTPIPPQTPNPIFKPSPRKLPIKRKIARSNSIPRPNPSTTPHHPTQGPSTPSGDRCSDPPLPPPFKFHRIWSETDEVRFLQGLLDSASDALSFPKHLPLFYSRFSAAMPQPFSKSQLSEKLRRLRKKHRVVSSRLARGLLRLDNLSPHDQALFRLSTKLWHPDHSATSPFASADSNHVKIEHSEQDLVGDRVSFSSDLTLPPPSDPSFIDDDYTAEKSGDGSSGDDDAIEADAGNNNDVNAVKETDQSEDDEATVKTLNSGAILGKVAGEIVIDVFDKCLRDVRRKLAKEDRSGDHSENGKAVNYQMRWRRQKVAELEVVAQRLRLILDHSLQNQ